MTLSLYFARRFLQTVALVFAGFFAVLFLIDMIEQVRRFAQAGIGLSETAELALFNVPASVYRILPLIVILAAIALFLSLARSSELVVVRAAGRSALRMLIAPVLVALVLGGFAVAVLNPLTAATSKRYETLSARYKLGEDNVLSVTKEGLWLRQGGEDGQTVIHALRSNLDGTVLFDTTFIAFSPQSGPVSRIDAARAELTAGAWLLTDAKEWPLSGDSNPEKGAVLRGEMRLASDLTADQIRDSFGTPETIPIWQLPGFISALERAGFTARRHQVWLQMELALPLFLATMVLVAAGFTMRHARSGRTGTMVLLAVAAGFAIFLLRNFAQVLGENGQLPILLAAWSPPIAAFLLATSLILHLEEG